MILEISHKAEKDLSGLNKTEAKKFLKKINQYIENPVSVEVTKLKGFNDYYRIRQGDYRVVFKVVDSSVKIMYVLRIQHRREAYRDL